MDGSEQIEQVEEQIEQGEQPPIQEVNYEEKAKQQGWVPKEEFRGDPSKHITAKEFVERAETLMPIMKGQLRKYETKFEKLERELKEKEDTLNRIVKVQKKYGEDTYSQRINEIEQKKRQAVRDGDEELYDQLTEQQKQIKPPEAIETKQEHQPEQKGDYTPPPALQKWVDENEWFMNNPDLNRHARAYGQMLMQDRPDLAVPGKEYEFGEEVKRQLMNDMPQKFANPNRNKTEIDETSVRGSDNIQTTGKTWNDLPQAARDYYNSRGQHIPGLTKERYVQEYFEA